MGKSTINGPFSIILCWFQQKPAAGTPHLKAKESTLEHPKHLARRRFGSAKLEEQPFRAALSQRKNAEDDIIYILYVLHIYILYI